MAAILTLFAFVALAHCAVHFWRRFRAQPWNVQALTWATGALIFFAWIESARPT